MARKRKSENVEVQALQATLDALDEAHNALGAILNVGRRDPNLVALLNQYQEIRRGCFQRLARIKERNG